MSNSHLDWIWSLYTTSPDAASGMSTLRDTCVALLSYPISSSHFVPALAGVALHPSLAEPFREVFPILKHLLYSAAELHGIVQPLFDCNHADFRMVTIIGVRQDEVKAVWDRLRQKVVDAMRGIESICMQSGLSVAGIEFNGTHPFITVPTPSSRSVATSAMESSRTASAKPTPMLPSRSTPSSRRLPPRAAHPVGKLAPRKEFHSRQASHAVEEFLDKGIAGRAEVSTQHVKAGLGHGDTKDIQGGVSFVSPRGLGTSPYEEIEDARMSHRESSATEHAKLKEPSLEDSAAVPCACDSVILRPCSVEKASVANSVLPTSEYEMQVEEPAESFQFPDVRADSARTLRKSVDTPTRATIRTSNANVEAARASRSESTEAEVGELDKRPDADDSVETATPTPALSVVNESAVMEPGGLEEESGRSAQISKYSDSRRTFGTSASPLPVLDPLASSPSVDSLHSDPVCKLGVMRAPIHSQGPTREFAAKRSECCVVKSERRKESMDKFSNDSLETYPGIDKGPISISGSESSTHPAIRSEDSCASMDHQGGEGAAVAVNASAASESDRGERDVDTHADEDEPGAKPGELKSLYSPAPSILAPERARDRENVEAVRVLHSEFSATDAATVYSRNTDAAAHRDTGKEAVGMQDSELRGDLHENLVLTADSSMKNSVLLTNRAHENPQESAEHAEPLARTITQTLFSDIEPVYGAHSESALTEPGELQESTGQSRSSMRQGSARTFETSIGEGRPVLISASEDAVHATGAAKEYQGSDRYITVDAFAASGLEHGERGVDTCADMDEPGAETEGLEESLNEFSKGSHKNDVRTFGIQASQGNDGPAFGLSLESPLLRSVILPAALASTIFALVSAIIRTFMVLCLGTRPLVGKRTPYRGWEREGIGTGDWKFDAAGVGARERI
ncbi:hypothetical protein B0H11DRAFT_2243086 [Mycena galericulata]|nr:hypothetical protein B0H11DRAFT_2243086 [Mycena galericulata]